MGKGIASKWPLVMATILGLLIFGCGGHTGGSTGTTATASTGALPPSTFLYGSNPYPTGGATFNLYAVNPSNNAISNQGTSINTLTNITAVPTSTTEFVAYNTAQTTVSGVAYPPGIYLITGVTTLTGWQLTGSSLITALPSGQAYLSSMAVTSDGKDVLFTASPGLSLAQSVLYIVPITGGVPTVLDSGFNDSNVVTSTDTPEVAYIRQAAGGTTVYWGAIAGGAVTIAFNPVTTDTGVHNSVTLSADGSTIAYEEGNSMIYIQVMGTSGWGTPIILNVPSGLTLEGNLALDTSGQNVAGFVNETGAPNGTELFYGTINNMAANGSSAWEFATPLFTGSGGNLIGPYWTTSNPGVTVLRKR